METRTHTKTHARADTRTHSARVEHSARAPKKNKRAQRSHFTLAAAAAAAHSREKRRLSSIRPSRQSVRANHARWPFECSFAKPKGRPITFVRVLATDCLFIEYLVHKIEVGRPLVCVFRRST